MSLKSFDRVAHVYDETRGLPPDVAKTIGESIARIARRVSQQPRLLEVGIGTGRMAVPVAAAGIRVTGIDVSPKMLALLRQKRDDIDVLLGEAARPPLRAATFDAALFVHILHLVPDAEATVDAALPLLKRGGIVMHGMDGRGDALRDKADAIIRSAVSDLAGVDISNEDTHKRAMETLLSRLIQAGAQIEREVLADWTASGRGRTMIDRLARKDYSSSWKIPDAALPAILERVTPEIDELYGGLDSVREWRRTFELTVGQLPG